MPAPTTIPRPSNNEVEEVDAEVLGEDENGKPDPRRELVPVAPTLAVTPTVTAGELTARLDVIKQAMEQAMTVDVDYGQIPGTQKPTLLKPGAEKLGVLFQLDLQIDNEKVWGPGDHLTVISRATVFHSPTGTRMGYGEGICTSREKKYGKRQRKQTCPDCEAEAILLSRDESEGYFCWRKRGGCGHKFPRNDERITKQETGEVENPELPDTWNTVVKMAEKRARVDAILAVTGASALFTQDAEDLGSQQAPPPAEDPGPVAESPPPPEEELEPEWVNHLIKGFSSLGMTGGQINQHIGAVGAEAPKLFRPDSIRKALRALTKEQADKLSAALDAEAVSQVND